MVVHPPDDERKDYDPLRLPPSSWFPSSSTDLRGEGKILGNREYLYPKTLFHSSSGYHGSFRVLPPSRTVFRSTGPMEEGLRTYVREYGVSYEIGLLCVSDV